MSAYKEIESIWGDASKISDVVSPFKDGDAKILDYSCSHNTLNLWLKLRGKDIYDGLLIRCIQCNDISMTRLVLSLIHI